MTGQDFNFLCDLVRQRSSIVLEPGKEYLVESRLAPMVRELKLESISALVSRLIANPYDGLASRVIEAMVTTETSFYRDFAPYEAIRQTILPELIRKRSMIRSLTFWSAAASTGQEAYTLAMTIREHFPELLSWRITILATDLSNEVLEKARQGKYNQVEVNRGLPIPLLVKYFRQHGTSWQLVDEVRQMVEFRQMNLAAPWPSIPPVDLLLLRNVMIYFDVPTKKVILGRVAKVLRPDGYLLLGGAETTFNLDDRYRRVEINKSGFYQLIGESA